MEINIRCIDLTRQINLNTRQRGQQIKHADGNNAALRDQIRPLLHHLCVCVHAYVLCHMFSCASWCVVSPGCQYNQLAFFGHVCASMYGHKTLIQAASTSDNNRRLKL